MNNGLNARRCVEKEIVTCFKISDLGAQRFQDARAPWRQVEAKILEAATDLEDLLFDPGIDESM